MFDRTLSRDKRFHFEPTVEKGSRRWWDKQEPLGPVEPAFALARLSPAAAAELCRYLIVTVSAPGGAENLFECPGVNAKLSALAAESGSLPWDDAQRARWNKALSSWVVPGT